jgi:hypothetical protein
LIPRSSEKAPGADTHYDHSHKKNSKDFVCSQLFVALFFIVRGINQRSHALPLCLKLSAKEGNSSKIKAARSLVRIAWKWLKNRNILLLCDSWYSKSSLILPLLKKNIQCIGQVRRDTAIFLPPSGYSGRGRPKKYVTKISKDNFHTMAAMRQKTIFAYGEERLFSFYEFYVLARFLKGQPCKAVWCGFQTKHKTTNWHLILSTDTNLSGDEIISLYSSRWAVEPAFNSIKNSVGVANAWQQSRRAFDRWGCILCIAYSISVLTTIFFGENLAEIMPVAWRRGQPMTAPWAARACSVLFGNFRVRACWDRKQQKLTIPK